MRWVRRRYARRARGGHLLQVLCFGLIALLGLGTVSLARVDVETGSARRVVIEGEVTSNFLILRVSRTSLRDALFARNPTESVRSVELVPLGHSEAATTYAAAVNSVFGHLPDGTSEGAPAPGPHLRILIPPNEIGRSSGLAHALATLDHLGGGGLTGGRLVAATGTVDEYGNVGPVGGLEAKLSAAREAGAAMVLMPIDQVGLVGPRGVVVVGVRSVSHATEVLCESGGSSPLCERPLPQGHSYSTGWSLGVSVAEGEGSLSESFSRSLSASQGTNSGSSFGLASP